jgi:hypothetical protein
MDDSRNCSAGLSIPSIDKKLTTLSEVATMNHNRLSVELGEDVLGIDMNDCVSDEVESVEDVVELATVFGGVTMVRSGQLKPKSRTLVFVW